MELNNYFNKLFSIAFLSLTAFIAGPSAGAAEEAGDKPDPYAAVDLDDLRADCFYKRAANNWTVLDRTRFIVYESGKRRPFLVEISPPSFELRSAQTIAFVSNNSRVCGHAGERVIVGRGRGHEQRFQIVSIVRLDEARRDELLAIRKAIRTGSKDASEAEAGADGSADPAESPATEQAGA